MKPLILNATPLIYITKIGLSRILENLKIEKLASPEVKKEVVDEGKRRGIPDAIVLGKMFENNVLKVVEPEDQELLSRLLKTKGLHIADAQTLVIAREQNGIAIIDDAVARNTAKIYGIAYAGTPYILIKAVSQKLITKEEARHAIDEMILAGWRCSIENYTTITKAVNTLRPQDF